jgi:general secretion pathway protein E
MRERQRIGQYLLRFVSEEELEQALKTQKKVKMRIGQILVDLGLLSEENLCRALSEQLELPLLEDKDFPEAPLELNGAISFKFLKNYHVLPLDRQDGRVRVVLTDPLDFSTLDDVRLALGAEDLEVCIATRGLVDKWLDTYYGEQPADMRSIVGQIQDDELEILGKDNEEDIDQLRDMASEAPVIRLVNLFINEAISKRASDIHIEPFEQRLRVRYRIDGILHDIESPPKRLQAAIVSRVKIMAELNIAERRLPQDGRIKMRVGGKKIDLRVSSIPTQFGESVVMRILDRSSIVLTVEELGFPEDYHRTFEKMIHIPHGIFLVTGPTGSGKTTTLYAALNSINSPDKKIITIEDPVEYQLTGVNQIQVNPKIDLTFAKGLRSIVRQDPDVILVGEIRDFETAEIAIQSALTGHLVFSTLHTNDAPSAITRLVDMGVEHFLVSSVLEGALAQRLVRIVCKGCARPTPLSAPILEELLQLKPDLPRSFTPVQGAGCEDCGGTGYIGRKGIFEFLVVNDELRALINQKVSSGELRKAARRHGMRTLREDGWRKVIRHETTVEEVLRVTQEEEFIIEE